MAEAISVKEYTDDIGYTISKASIDWSSVDAAISTGASVIKTEDARILHLESRVSELEYENAKLKRSYQKLLIAIMNIAEEALNDVE
jgi:hypothetical protein